jgi:bifunctional pyridoxal-dependent enzyme with beta-cystathionase and maltose regulon repressor activities
MHLITKEHIIKHLKKISSHASIGYVVVDNTYSDSVQSVTREQEAELFFPPSCPVVFTEQKLISFSSIHHQLQKEDTEQITPIDDHRPLDEKILPIGS